MTITNDSWDGVEVIRMESAELLLVVAPSVGGRVVSLIDRASGYEFLWRNSGLSLRQEESGSEYDPSFYGGIDELLPNDVPEFIGRGESPDHGELWTLPLASSLDENALTLRGVLPSCGLSYQRRMSVEGRTVKSEYEIRNTSESPVAFLWKLHASLKIEPGDRIICRADRVRAGDPDWSSLKSTEPVAWPPGGGDAYVVPEFDGTTEFLHLDGIRKGSMRWESKDGKRYFQYRFDQAVFPYPWYFASYGGFDGHLVGLLEPCTTSGLKVSEAAQAGQTAVLHPGETLRTTVLLEVGAEL